MIDTLLNLLFRCPHRHLTRPVAPITKAGQPHSQSYVVCLDCGKQFEYDLNEMRIGKAIDHSHHVGVVPPRTRLSPATKVKYGFLAAVPVALLINAIVKNRKSGPQKNVPGADEPAAQNESGPGAPQGE